MTSPPDRSSLPGFVPPMPEWMQPFPAIPSQADVPEATQKKLERLCREITDVGFKICKVFTPEQHKNFPRGGSTNFHTALNKINGQIVLFTETMRSLSDYQPTLRDQEVIGEQFKQLFAFKEMLRENRESYREAFQQDPAYDAPLKKNASYVIDLERDTAEEKSGEANPQRHSVSHFHLTWFEKIQKLMDDYIQTAAELCGAELRMVNGHEMAAMDSEVEPETKVTPHLIIKVIQPSASRDNTG